MTLLLSLQLALLRAKKGFPRFIGYPNFINDLTKLVSSQTLAHAQLPSLSKVLTSCLTAISAVDGFQTRLRSDEKYTQRSKGLIWYQIKGFYVFFHFPVVFGSEKCSVLL